MSNFEGIDPRLIGVRKRVVSEVYKSYIQSLIRSGLINADGTVTNPEFESPLETCALTIINGLNLVFQQSELRGIKPSDYIEENILVLSIIQGLGIPEISLTESTIEVNFMGNKPHVQSVSTTLDGQPTIPVGDDMVNSFATLHKLIVVPSGVENLTPNTPKNQILQ